MKLILVTGGAGHVGSHLIEELLLDKDNKIISLDNYFIGSTNNHIQDPRVKYIKGSTADIFGLIKEVPDIIYHLGEYARVTPSIDEPDKVFAMNTTGTLAVVEFCRQKKVKKLVYAASSTKFGDDGNGGNGKNHSPYSFSKAVNVDLITNYGKWYGLPHAICYFFNAFGPRERGDELYGTVVAIFQKAYLEGTPLKVVLPGTQRRNYTYVKDLAKGLILAGEKGNGDGYALNNTKSYSVMEIAEAFGCEIEKVQGRPGRNGTADLPTNARDELGWTTTVDVLDYIRDFVRKNPRG